LGFLHRNVSLGFFLKRFGIDFAGADPHGAFNVENEDLAVTDLTGVRGLRYRFDHLVGQVIGYHDFDFYLWQEADVIFRTTIDFSLAFLAAKTLHFRHGQSLNPKRGQGFPDVVELEGLDDGHNEFHVGQSSGVSLGLGETCILGILSCRCVASLWWQRPGRDRGSFNNRANSAFGSQGLVSFAQAMFQTRMMHINWAVARYDHTATRNEAA
jgi:hypothetical protein